MGKITGFLEEGREKQPYRPVDTSLALYGLWYSVLSPGLSAGQHDPGLE